MPRSGATDAAYSLGDTFVEGWTVSTNPDGTTTQTVTLGFANAIVDARKI